MRQVPRRRGGEAEMKRKNRAEMRCCLAKMKCKPRGGQCRAIQDERGKEGAQGKRRQERGGVESLDFVLGF